MIDRQAQSMINAKLHGLMNQASSAPADTLKMAWNIVMRAVLHAYRQDELHASVRERFFKDCPAQFKDIHFRFQRETGQLPTPVEVRRRRARGIVSRYAEAAT
jgi:hypothetical protein